MGIHAWHTWRFREQDNNVKLLSVERFKGLMIWVVYLFNVPDRLHRLTVEFLGTLKETAESCSK